MFEVTQWLEQLQQVAQIPAERQLPIVRQLLWEVVERLGQQCGIPATLALDAQLYLLNAALGVPSALAESVVALLRWLSHGEPDQERLPAVRRTLEQWLAWIGGERGEVDSAELFPPQMGELPWQKGGVRLIVLGSEPGSQEKPARLIGRWDGSREVVTVLLFPPWEELAHEVWRGATVALLGAKAVRAPGLWALGERGVAVLEPDRLVDVTEVAATARPRSCRWSWVLRWFEAGGFSAAALRGWLLNFCFDEALVGKADSVEGLLRRARLARPLSFLMLEAVGGEGVASVQELEQACRESLPLLLRVAGLLRQRSLLVEPAFLAPRYGMQGRLDALVLDAAGLPETLLELKAGVPPRQAAWEEHRLQVTCYDLLLHGTIGRRARRRWLFYCRDGLSPIREVRPGVEDFQAAVQQRNRLVAAQWQFLQGACSLGEMLQQAGQAEGVLTWAEAYAGLQGPERAYVEELARFVLRERWVQTRSLAATQPERGLSFLTLDAEATDWERLHLCLRRTERSSPVTALRPGDSVLLFPLTEQGEPLLYAGPVLKGTLRAVGEEVWLSLRNKHLEQQWCQQWRWWELQPDGADQFLEAQWAALGRFLQAPAQKRWRLLGMLPPRRRQGSQSRELPEELSQDQRELVAKALAAADYVLIQGPPGTGKTAVVLRTLVQLLFQDPEERLLVVAYTNRAVDEICRVLGAVGIPFLRLGSKEATEYPETLLSTAAERMPWREFVRSVFQCRVVVGTVAAVLLAPELFALKHFTTLLVDEASQLLESHLIGLLCAAERAILIGDERQLPAVVLQPAEAARVTDEGLRQLGFVSFAESLFERLLRQCVQKGWHHCYGMLRRQARMHPVLQDFPSVAFYGGQLQTAGAAHQRSASLRFPVVPQTRLEELLGRQRLVFINCAPQPRAHGYHEEQALMAALVVQVLARLWGEEFSSSRVGVIAPYRLQVRHILERIPAELRRQVTVDTVERFQGSERDSIVVSLAVNHAAEMEFLHSLVCLPDGTVVDRRLNVMLTRARQQLILLGCGEVLRRSPLYARLLDFIARRGCIVEAAELMAMQMEPLSL